MGTLYLVDGDDLTYEANRIRAKTGSASLIPFAAGKGFGDAIDAIPSGGGDSKDVNAVASGTWWPQRVDINTATSIKSRSLNYMVGAEVLFVGSQVLTVEAYPVNNDNDLHTIVWNAATANVAAPFINNSALTIFDGTFDSNIGTLGWQNCPNLSTIILRRTNGICGLPNINCFNNTPFKSGGAGGTIYIPKALYDHLGDGTALDYKAATNWSTINGYGTITWAKIEGSIYENAYADGTPIT